MAIKTGDFTEYYLSLNRLRAGEPIERKPKRKWWNKIIQKVEEGQIIPNGIGYKFSNDKYRTRFSIIIRIYELRMNFELLKRLVYKDYDGYCYMEGEKSKAAGCFKFTVNYR